MSDESIKRALEETLTTPMDSYTVAMFRELEKQFGKDHTFCKLIQLYSNFTYDHFFRSVCLKLYNSYGTSDSLKSDLLILIGLMDRSIEDKLATIKHLIRVNALALSKEYRPAAQTTGSFGSPKG